MTRRLLRSITSAHNFCSTKPVIVAEESELADPDALLVRAFNEAGYISETEAKRAGKQRLELKTYIIQDYDVVNFRFNK